MEREKKIQIKSEWEKIKNLIKMLSLVDASSLCAAEYSISCSIKIKLYSLVLLQNADMVCPEKKSTKRE